MFDDGNSPPDPTAPALDASQPSDAEWSVARQRLLSQYAQALDEAALDPVLRRRLCQGSEELISSESADASLLAGLTDVVASLTALRHELKLQTKSNRTLVERIAADADRFFEGAATIASALAELPQSVNSADVARRLADALADTDEAVGRLQTAMRNLVGSWGVPPERPSGWFLARAAGSAWDAVEQRWREHRQRLEDMAEGTRLLATRLDAHLSDQGIQRIGAVGETVDPHTMQVLRVVADSSSPGGTVVELLRPGYRYRSVILRPAQVAAASASAAGGSGDNRENP